MHDRYRAFRWKDGVVGSGQLDSDFIMAWQLDNVANVKRNQVLGLTPDLPDLPEFSIKVTFRQGRCGDDRDAGDHQSAGYRARRASTGQLSLSMSFGSRIPRPNAGAAATDYPHPGDQGDWPRARPPR